MSAQGAAILVLLLLISAFLLAHWRQVLAVLAIGAVSVFLYGVMDIMAKLRQ
jgi:hypothetical protein